MTLALSPGFPVDARRVHCRTTHRIPSLLRQRRTGGDVLKTDYAGDLRGADAGREVVIAGWVHRRRDHGGLIFLDLRDSTGLVQVVVNPDQAAAARARRQRVRGEYVVQVQGHGRAPPRRHRERQAADRRDRGPRARRPSSTPRRRRRSTSTRTREIDEVLRLRYRYLDLRRERMHATWSCAHRVVKFIRDFLTDRGFLEIETPMLANPTPEGARDYLVPSRVHPGQLLRAAAVAAAVQAAADGRRLRALLPDRPLLPRRGPARRPPARVHAARPRDELRRAGGHPAADRGAVRRDGAHGAARPRS